MGEKQGQLEFVLVFLIQFKVFVYFFKKCECNAHENARCTLKSSVNQQNMYQQHKLHLA